MTDPQEDKPCRDCKRPTQHASERCDDCRTPAGRILAALTARGIKGDNIDSFDVLVGQVLVSADGLSWCLMCEDGTSDHDDNIEAAANAIAAIVQAPGLRAELDALDEALRDACPSYTTPAGSVSRVEAARDLAAENARLRSALYQAKVAARFPDAFDAWDQVRDAVSVLDEVPNAR